MGTSCGTYAQATDCAKFHGLQEGESRAAAAVSLTLILQLHETALIKGLGGWDSSPPTLHTI